MVLLFCIKLFKQNNLEIDKMKKLIILNVGIILLAGLVRILPHPWNFTPVLAACIYSGCYLNNIFLALSLPLIAVFAGDVSLGLYNGIIWVYTAYIFVILLGVLFKDNFSFKKNALLAVSGSIIFFIISNFGVWFGGTIYPKNLAGLTACYIAAIPFFYNSLLGTLMYSGIFFGLTEWIKARMNKPRIIPEFR